jgi:hypothetical protein
LGRKVEVKDVKTEGFVGWMGKSGLRRIDMEPCMLSREAVIQAMKGRKLGLRGSISVIRDHKRYGKFQKFAGLSPIHDIRFLDS